MLSALEMEFYSRLLEVLKIGIENSIKWVTNVILRLNNTLSIHGDRKKMNISSLLFHSLCMNHKQTKHQSKTEPIKSRFK